MATFCAVDSVSLTVVPQGQARTLEISGLRMGTSNQIKRWTRAHVKHLLALIDVSQNHRKIAAK